MSLKMFVINMNVNSNFSLNFSDDESSFNGLIYFD